MTHRDSHKEPTFSESGDQPNRDDELFDSRLPRRDKLDPRLRLAAIAVVIACTIFVADRFYQRYMERQAVEELNEMFTGFADTAEAEMRQARAESERRMATLRKQRANTNQGKWLAKNCSDWRRTYEDLGSATAEREMKKHCRIYEKYLNTGIAATRIR